MKILIADDDLTTRMVIANALEKRNYDVIEANDGEEALNILTSEDPPLIGIIDWVMPFIDGLEVIRKIRAIKTDKPPYLIILSGKDNKDDIITALDVGANDYLTKLFHTGELLARVNVGHRFIEMHSELLEAKNALKYEATHDSLTGILNRKAIEEILSHEISREKRQKQGLTIGICDIDYFKKVNDTYGHPTGDEVICSIVNTLTSCLRDYDFIGRLGGEEFLIITSGVSNNNNYPLYERLLKSISCQPILTKNGKLNVTISIGVTTSQDNQTKDQLIQSADAALYRAKGKGRNRIEFD